MTTSVAYPGTQAVRRALALLKAVGGAPPERGLSDLARAVGLNKTTAYRLLSALEGEGLVVREGVTETYRLGPEAIALGARAFRSNDLRAGAREDLEALAAGTGETATLEILAGGEVLTLDEAHGPHLVATVPSVGGRWPAHATSTGKVLLAELPDREVRAATGGRLSRFTPATITSFGVLREELGRVRAQGHALALEELEPGFAAVGAPVRDHTGRVVAAVSLGGPTVRMKRDRLPVLVRAVRDAADRVSRRMGWDGH